MLARRVVKTPQASSSPSGTGFRASYFDNKFQRRKGRNKQGSGPGVETWLLIVMGGFALVFFAAHYFAFVVHPLSSLSSSANNKGTDKRYTPMMMANIVNHSSMFAPKSKGQQHHQQQKKDKAGRVVHKEIKAVRKEDLKGLVADDFEKYANMTYEEAIKGREPLIDILNDAGVEELDVPSVLSLPKWSSVTKLYGDSGPVVIGLDRCERFQQTTDIIDSSIGVAGMFNTGTNPFSMYLQANCLMPHNKHDRYGGMRWQVPWGKHTLASRRNTNTAGNDAKVNKTNVMPVVIVRDPYTWMQSMCKHPYAAKWNHTKKHCPNLVPTPDDFAIGVPPSDGTKSVKVHVRYTPPKDYDSLAHFWTGWVKEYLDADYPRLLVRFEDLQFHAREMIDLVCNCAGAVPRNENGEFTYIVDSAKWGPGHGGQNQQKTNLISAMIKYGTDKDRFNTMTKEDMELAAEALDPELMQLFHYEIPSI